MGNRASRSLWCFMFTHPFLSQRGVLEEKEREKRAAGCAIGDGGGVRPPPSSKYMLKNGFKYEQHSGSNSLPPSNLVSNGRFCFTSGSSLSQCLLATQQQQQQQHIQQQRTAYILLPRTKTFQNPRTSCSKCDEPRGRPPYAMPILLARRSSCSSLSLLRRASSATDPAPGANLPAHDCHELAS